MNLAQLRYLAAFGEHGTVSRAAETLRVSQPALSRALHALEEELQMRLLDRVGRKLVFTAEGKVVLAAARRALAAFDDVKTTAQGVRPRPHLTLAVYFPLVAVLAETVGAFVRHRPEVRLRTMRAGSTQAVAEMILNGAAELGFGEAVEPPDGLRFTPYGDLEIVLMSPPGSALPPVVDFAVLATIPLVSVPASAHRKRMFDDILLAAGIRPRIVLETDDTQGFIQAVQSGIGSALAWRKVCDGVPGVEMHRFSPPRTHAVGYLHRPGIGPDARAFIAAAQPT